MAVELPPQHVQQTELPPQQTLAGVACTASLATDRPKQGPHRVHVALQTAAVSAIWWLQLQKDRRTRAEEERLAGQLVLNAVAEACGIAQRLKLELLEGEQVQASRAEAPPAWQDLLLGKVERVCVGRVNASPQAIFAGAFNPLHVGHRRMIEIAQQMLQQPVAWEISILNVDKPPLDYIELERRLGQFSSDDAVYLTRAATFERNRGYFPKRRSSWASIRCGASRSRAIMAATRPRARRHWNESPAGHAGFWSSAATWASGSFAWPISTCPMYSAQFVAKFRRKFFARTSRQPPCENPGRGESCCWK